MQSTFLKAMAGAGVVLTMASSVSASIVFTDIPDIHVVPPTGTGTYTDTATFIIDSVHGTGLGLSVTTSRAPPFGVTSSHATMTLLGGTGCIVGIQSPPSLFEPYPLAAGNSIEPIVVIGPPPPTRLWTSTSSAQNLSTYDGPESQNYGYWRGIGYLGICLPAPGGVRYGWVRMSADSYQITIYSFAIETSVNTPISAGAVPAPGTLVVAGLALSGLRRRGRIAIAGS